MILAVVTFLLSVSAEGFLLPVTAGVSLLAGGLLLVYTVLTVVWTSLGPPITRLEGSVRPLCFLPRPLPLPLRAALLTLREERSSGLVLGIGVAVVLNGVGLVTDSRDELSSLELLSLSELLEDLKVRCTPPDTVFFLVTWSFLVVPTAGGGDCGLFTAVMLGRVGMA